MAMKPAQQTVRFQTESEMRLLSMMAAAAGVSASEWIATAARERMLQWLRHGWNGDIINKDLASVYDAELVAAIAGAPGSKDAADAITTRSEPPATRR